MPQSVCHVGRNNIWKVTSQQFLCFSEIDNPKGAITSHNDRLGVKVGRVWTSLSSFFFVINNQVQQHECLQKEIALKWLLLSPLRWIIPSRPSCVAIWIRYIWAFKGPVCFKQSVCRMGRNNIWNVPSPHSFDNFYTSLKSRWSSKHSHLTQWLKSWSWVCRV